MAVLNRGRDHHGHPHRVHLRPARLPGHDEGESAQPGPSLTGQWLSPAERALAQRRMARDAGEADDNGSMTNGQAVIAVFTDVKAWILTSALTSAVCVSIDNVLLD